MKKLLTSVAIIATIAAVLTVGGGSARAATTCMVPTLTYMTIQSAVNNSSCSTIEVATGVYNENVTVPRNVIINGAQAGVPAPGRVGPESEVKGANPSGGNPVFLITAANVRIDGFTVRNAIIMGAAIGIDVKTPGTGDVITNNIIDGVTTADTTSQGSAQAIYLENGPDNVTITNNDLKNVTSLRSAKGVHIGDAGSMNPSVNILIQGNSIENITSNDRGSYGVSINNGNGATQNSGLTVEDNTISTLTALGAGGWVHAIGLEANTPNVSVQGNSINPLATAGFDAIAVWFEANPSFSTAKVNENNFNVTVAAYGIAVQTTIAGMGAVDGTCNWWGSPDGPGPIGPSLVGAKVSQRVDYTPWLTAPHPIGACLGGQPSSEGKVTGGGQIPGDDPLFSPTGDLISLPALTMSSANSNGKATFGLSVRCCPERGNLEYNDHEADVRIKAQTVDHLSIGPSTACLGGQHAQFTGMASVIRSSGTTSEPYTVDVDDCGEPGTMDTFGIRATTYMNYPPKTLLGGNIQIHK